uniref:Uncharacterized protein n=1 Tax=uncultured Prevotella sp. TaxID=159272 RepID=A0A6G8F217_9BACT|nr:hypothetical protein Prevot485_3310 [uncultured Prevotella sp.]
MTVMSIGDTAMSVMRGIAAVSFALGTVAFAVMQMLQVYEGNDITILRLRRIMLFGNVCMILSGLLMLEQTFRIVYPLFATSIEGYNNYYHYVHNNWGVFLLISCILELYVVFRLSTEIKKEA